MVHYRIILIGFTYVAGKCRGVLQVNVGGCAMKLNQMSITWRGKKSAKSFDIHHMYCNLWFSRAQKRLESLKPENAPSTCSNLKKFAQMSVTIRTSEMDSIHFG